jgi:histidinol-phosphate aminotransferase
MNEKHLRVSKRLSGHLAYSPGEQPIGNQGVIKLNTNENPYPPSALVLDAIVKEVPLLNLYPNPRSNNLRRVIANLHGLNPSQIIVGNGSDDLLNLCVRCFSDDVLKVGMLYPSYSLYEVLTGVQGSEMIRIPFSDNQFLLKPEDISTSGANLFFLTNPHAPSGRVYAIDELRSILKGFPGLLVVDEAYADFSDQNAVGLLNEYENLVITRTLSKSYSLAGLRVGYAMGSTQIIEQLDKVREVYNLDRLAQVAAIAALEDRDYFNRNIAKIIEQREQFCKILADFGWSYIPSGANFIFVEPKNHNGIVGSEVALSLFQHLEENKILVRYFPKHILTNSFLRISIGNEEEMVILLESIKSWIRKELLR